MNEYNKTTLIKIIEDLTSFFNEIPENEEYGCGCMSKRISDTERVIYIGLQKNPCEKGKDLSYMDIFRKGLK